MATTITAPILVGYDGSDDAGLALEFAAREAKRTKSQLDIVYVADDTISNSAWGVVYDPEAVQKAAREVLAEAVRIAREHGAAKKRIRTQIAVGSPISVLTQLSGNVSLLAIGRSAAAQDRRFAGSTAVDLAATAKCPLVVVGQHSAATEGGPIGVAVESSGKGEDALAWALAHRGSAGVRVFSVCREPSSRLFRSRLSQEQIDEALRATRERVQHLVARATTPEESSAVTTEVLYGAPVDQLMSHSGDLSLMVLQANPTFPTYSVGGTIRGVLAHASCPVVIVR